MTLKALINSSTLNLNNDQKSDLTYLLLELLNIDLKDFYLLEENIVSEDIIKKYNKLRNKYLNKNIPVQHLIGHTYFYDSKFYVNKHTLIPRKETEILVEETYNFLKSKYDDLSKLKILDLACGSGIIGLTLKKLTNASVTLSDISNKALKIADKNKNSLGLDVNIIKSNWFNNIKDKYDVIISNPPYIGLNEKLDIKVLKEPKNALFSGIDGFDSYKTILSSIENYLNDKFVISFEHGFSQSEKLEKIITSNLSNIEVKKIKDYSNLDRIIIISRD